MTADGRRYPCAGTATNSCPVRFRKPGLTCHWCAEIEGGAAKAAHEARAAEWRRGGPPHRVPLAWSVAAAQVEPEPELPQPDDHVLRFDADSFGAELAAQMSSRKVTTLDVAEATGVRVDVVRRAVHGWPPGVDDLLALAHWLREPNVLRWSIAVPREPAAAPAESDADAITRHVGAPLPPGGREAK